MVHPLHMTRMIFIEVVMELLSASQDIMIVMMEHAIGQATTVAGIARVVVSVSRYITRK